MTKKELITMLAPFADEQEIMAEVVSDRPDAYVLLSRIGSLRASPCDLSGNLAVWISLPEEVAGRQGSVGK